MKLDNFWFVGKIERPGCDYLTLKLKEDELNILLPEKYKYLMQRSNGGVSEYDLFIDNKWVTLTPFLSIDEVKFISVEAGDLTLKNFLEIGTDGIASYGLVYDSTNRPSVWYTEHIGKTQKISESFEEFINLMGKMESDAPYENRVISGQDFSELNILVSKLGVNWKNEYGHSLAQLAAAMGAERSLVFFMKKGADTSGALELAKLNKRKNVIDILSLGSSSMH